MAKKKILTVNEFYSILRDRMNFANLDGPRRDIDKECQYPKTIDAETFYEMYSREGVAQRVVNLYPDECFAVDPEIYETERPRNTPFEQTWVDMVNSATINPLHYLHRIDRLSGIGRFGIMLLGIDDGRNLADPARGIDKYGRMESDAPERQINFYRVFDEKLVKIKTWVTDIANPRYGFPETYDLTFSAVKDGDNLYEPEQKHTVHWSRVLHVADNCATSEVHGVPRLLQVYNRLLDIRKTLAGAGEMFWKGGFPGIVVKTDPRFIEAGGVEIDQESIDDQIRLYMDGLQRYLSLVGMDAESLAPQIADPTNHFTVQLQAIALAIGSPLRILMGSEEGKLAAGQDAKAWNRRLSRRHTKYLNPRLIRPLIDRLIMLRCMPPPKGKTASTTASKWNYNKELQYKIFWPDINMPDEDERSTIADRSMATIMKFMSSNAYKLIQPSDFWKMIMGKTQAEVDQIMENIKKEPEIDLAPDPAELGMTAAIPGKPGAGVKKKKPSKPGDSGVAGKPPSDPKPVSK